MIAHSGLRQLAQALEAGEVTAVSLAMDALERIAAYDRAGPLLNAVPILNPTLFDDAMASDRRRAAGQALGPLDGIPYTAKGSFKAKGLPVDSGSPAFAGLIAQEDSFAIERLRAAGAVLLGLTTMPPMANGGMQRGLHGRAESPWSGEWLTSAFASGSSNGSGSAVAAGFGAFGLGEETWSSGRAPAALNGFCAYTPGRGVISVRGNWPLVPTMDVVVPHTRSVEDLLLVMDILGVEDPRTGGDFWRRQPWVPVAPPRPPSWSALNGTGALAGKRLGIPAMYLNADPRAGTNPYGGIGGPTGQRIDTRASILDLWAELRAKLEQAGAEIALLDDFPLVTRYEGDRPGAPTIATRGLVSAAYLKREIVDLSVWAWDDFLRANGDPRLNRLAQVDGATIFPQPDGALPDRYTGFDDDIAQYPDHARAHPCADFRTIPHLAEGLAGLEETRRQDMALWMEAEGLDAAIFPALADVAPADADVSPASADLAWRNGTWVANGNLAIRHFGIPTVTVPMGIMADTGMPMGLTLAGRGGDDPSLIALAQAVEALTPPSPVPPRTPPLPAPPVVPLSPEAQSPRLTVTATTEGEVLHLRITADRPIRHLSVAGQEVSPGNEVSLPRNRHRHSAYSPPHGPLVVALFTDGTAAFADIPA
ncbi:amidase [Cereibacter sphaeroides]|nr:amidase [Cereibacter sphaeroides]